MICNHLFFWGGMGWEHQPARLSTHQQLKLADDTHVHRLLLPTFPVALMHPVKSMGEGRFLGIERARFGAFRIQAASPKLIILMAHALLDAQCQGAYLRSTGRASRLEDWFLLVVEISSAAEHHGTDPSKVLLNLRCLSKCILMQHLSIRRHGAHRTPTKYQSLCMKPQEGIAAESALKQEQRRTTG